MTLVLIGLVGGIITGLSPCVLPVLPVVLLGGRQRGTRRRRARARRPYLVVLGLTLSFSVFTLLGTLIAGRAAAAGGHHPLGRAGRCWCCSASAMIVPPLEHLLERPFSRIPAASRGTDHSGFVLGLALGAVYVPCAGPVLAAITVAGATGQIGWRTIVLTLGFAVGTAIPLLVFALAGRAAWPSGIGAFRRHQRRDPRRSRRGGDRAGRRADVQPVPTPSSARSRLHPGRGQLTGEGRGARRSKRQRRRVAGGLPGGAPSTAGPGSSTAAPRPPSPASSSG